MKNVYLILLGVFICINLKAQHHTDEHSKIDRKGRNDSKKIVAGNKLVNLVAAANPLSAVGEETSINLLWSDIFDGETGYQLEESSDGIEYSTIAILSAETTSYSIIDLIPDTEYYFRLTASFEVAEPQVFDIQTATLPNSPTDLIVTVDSPVELTLNWTDNSTIEELFIVERSTMENEGFGEVARIRSNITTYTDKTLSPVTTYFYRVVASGVSGVSAGSNVASGTTSESRIYYVDSDLTGTHLGTSWEDAFTDLTDALSHAGNGDQVWVANREGGYLPGSDDPGPSSSFNIIQIGLKLYGGFEGNESSVDERPENSLTILSGDIGAIDDPSDNVSTIVTIPVTTNTVLIDGFKIIKGNGHSLGAGIFSKSNLIISNCEFTSNSGLDGGAIYISGQSELVDIPQATNKKSLVIGLGPSPIDLTIINSSFSDNSAINTGGAVYYDASGLLSITNSSFEANSVLGQGGALQVKAGSITIENSSFSSNSAEIIELSINSGGAIYADSNVESLTIDGSDFIDNQASNAPGEGGGGGAIYTSGVTLSISNSKFTGNHSSKIGGGIHHSGDNLTISNCLFSENTANAGGGMASGSDLITITNSTFSKNEATKRGGGIAVRSWPAATNLSIVNSTFSENSAGTTGGGIHWGATNTDSNASLSHVTIFNNTSTQTGGGVSVFREANNTVSFSNTIIAGNTGANNGHDIGLTTGEGGGGIMIMIHSLGHNLIGDVGDFIFNTNTTGDQYGDTQDTTEPNDGASESVTAIDPLLGQLADNFSDIPLNALLGGSPAIDAGSIIQIEDEDLLTDQRGLPYVGTPDIGAFEYYLTFPPVLDNSKSFSLTSINEDDVNNPGDLFDDIGGDVEVVTDIDGPGDGIAVTAVNTSAGTWQYTLDNGRTWVNIGSPSTTAALLIPSTDQAGVRLQPALNFNGTVEEGLTFKAWDQSAGEAGGTLDVSTFTIASPFSENSETISIIVNPVNDAPVVINPIADQEIPLGSFTFTFDENVFNDVEEGTILAYSSDGLPAYLNFDAATRTFSGSLIPGTSGTSTITVTAADSEGATGSEVFEIVINPLLGLDDGSIKQSVIYPVPNNGDINLSVTNDFTGEVNLSIVDESGRNVFSKKFLKTQSTLKTAFNLGHLREGVYIMNINTGHKRIVKRFTKQ